MYSNSKFIGNSSGTGTFTVCKPIRVLCRKGNEVVER
jgi:hypothetical protein